MIPTMACLICNRLVATGGVCPSCASPEDGEFNRMIGSHQDHVRRLMDELAIARVCIRELGDRLSRLEKTEQEPVGKFAKFTDGIWRPVTDYSAGVPLYTTPPQQRTWVGLTDEEVTEVAQHFTESEGFRHGVDWAEAKLREVNT